jgi:hypothetical protein
MKKGLRLLQKLSLDILLLTCVRNIDLMKKGLRLEDVDRHSFDSSREKHRPYEEGTVGVTLNDGQRTMNKRRRDAFFDFKVQGSWFIVQGSS